MDQFEAPLRDDRAITRLAMSHDASHFLLTPSEIVTPRNIADVAQLMQETLARRAYITFRGGGTSLSGQCVTDGILVDIRKNFRDIEVLDDGMRVRAGAGATLAAVNARLSAYGRRLGPDPTSEIACTIGGIVANNSSGMLAGATQTAYQTIDSMVFVLPSGRIVNTADPSADIGLRLEETALVGGLHMLRKRLRTNPDSIADINRLFAMKNTMGYALNALTEFHRPVDIIAHLLVGSEGTLGFIAEVTFHTFPLARHSAAALALFPTLGDATDAVAPLAEHGFESIELMDTAALRVVREQRNAPETVREATLTTQAALLIELYDTDEDTLNDRINAAGHALLGLNVVDQVELATDRTSRNSLVGMRRGLYALVAGARPSGTTTLLEDICVPLDRLTETCQALNELFDKHGYGALEVPLFGHVRDGNVQFLLTERFDSDAGLIRYRKFSRALVREVLRRGGVLRAEHGTGRAMAPFLLRQYGDELYDVMREIKHLFDPVGILNPGVLISDDPDEHLTNLKLMPTIEAQVDACIECGFCEPGCPSRHLTLTPRQRIVLRREIAARRDDEELINQIEDEEYTYAAVETCTASGMCALACPLGIDTGGLVKLQRASHIGRVEKAAWNHAAKHWGRATRMGSTALTMAKTSRPLARATASLGRKTFGDDAIPSLGEDLPRGSGLRRQPRRGDIPGGEVAVYFPSCLQSVFGTQGQGVFSAFNELCRRAGVSVRLLDAEDLCCGTPWLSKGLAEGYATMRRKLVAALEGVSVSLVSDASNCSAALREITLGQHDVRDIVEFADEVLLPRLRVTSRLDTLALHPTCGSAHLGIDDALLRVARFVADQVVVPRDWSCCGFAGDRGLLHPELTSAATAEMAVELAGRGFTAYASLNRTCEIAMSRAIGQPYVHIIELLAAATG